MPTTGVTGKQRVAQGLELHGDLSTIRADLDIFVWKSTGKLHGNSNLLQKRMNTVSSHELLQSLRAIANPTDSQRHDGPSVAEALTQLAAPQDITVIPEIMDFLLWPDRRVHDAAVEAIHRLLSSATTRDWNWLMLRPDSRLNVNSPWRSLKPDALASFANLPHGNLLLGLTTLHANDEVREAAVRTLAQLRDLRDITEVSFRLLCRRHRLELIQAWTLGKGAGERGNSEHIIRILPEAIDFDSVPGFLFMLLLPDRELQRGAADTIHRVIAGNWHDFYKRSSGHRMIDDSPWRLLSPEKVASLAGLYRGNFILGLASFHENGYVRLAAVQQLASVTDGSEIPFLLLRLKDWVPEIRSEALRVLHSKSVPHYALYFVENLLYLTQRLQFHGGYGAPRIIERFLTTPDARPALQAGLASSDRRIRLRCARIVARSEAGNGLELLKEMLLDVEPSVRLSTLLHAMQDMPANDLRTLMFDLRASIRAAARRRLSYQSSVDVRAICVEALRSDDPHVLVSAVEGLGERGQPEDVELLLPLLESPSNTLCNSVRCSIHALAGEKFFEDLSLNVMDQSKAGHSLKLLKDLVLATEPVLRLRIVERVLPSVPEESLRELLPTLTRDSYMPVRREALVTFAKRLPELADEALRYALFDSHESVRAAARYYLKQRGIDGFPLTYRNALASAESYYLSGAIAGLGETGSREDAQLLVPFLRSSSVNQRKAAVRSIDALDGTRFLNEILAALRDDHPGVSRTARVALEQPRYRFLLDENFLVETFNEESRQHVRKNVLLLSENLPRENRVRITSLASADSEPSVAEIARNLHSRNQCDPAPYLR